MTLQQFVATENSQALDYDGIPADTGQCVQVVSYYCVNVLNITPPALNAVDWWNDYGSTSVLSGNFDQIPYSATSMPAVGDIVVFGASSDINSPLYGHIDIAISVGAPSGYTGFDSNWGGDYNAQGYPVAHQVQHTYGDVLGYLRIKETPMDTMTAGRIYNLLFHAVSPEVAITAQNADYVGYFGAGIGQEVGAAYDEIIASPQFDELVAASKGTAVNKETVIAYVEANLS